MAGAQNIGESSDNPVAINVTAMVDVIFCLCIFFMCSFHFKQLAGKMDSWLPQDKGMNEGAAAPADLDEIRVQMTFDGTRTIYQVGSRQITEPRELETYIVAQSGDYQRAGNLDVPVILDAHPAVPWRDVVTVMNLCKRNNIDKIEFSFAPTGIGGPTSAPVSAAAR
jgi:biopolymer transport protein ExbD